MTKNDIDLIYQYDRWANNRVFQAASSLSSEDLTRNLGGGFPSVRDTLVHIVAAEWIWLTYWNEPVRSSEFLTDLRTRREALFAADLFPDLATIQRKWTEVEKEQIEFVQRLTGEVLGEMIEFRSGQVRLELLMQHLANHSTYHRGQLSLMMRQLRAEPAATDFHLFVAETM